MKKRKESTIKANWIKYILTLGYFFALSILIYLILKSYFNPYGFPYDYSNFDWLEIFLIPFLIILPFVYTIAIHNSIKNSAYVFIISIVLMLSKWFREIGIDSDYFGGSFAILMFFTMVFPYIVSSFFGGLLSRYIYRTSGKVRYILISLPFVICIILLAALHITVVTSNEQYCQSIEDSFKSNSCLYSVAKQTNNLALCFKLSSSYKNVCIDDVTNKMHKLGILDISICDGLDLENQGYCIAEIAKYQLDPSLCAEIKDMSGYSQSKAKCNMYIAIDKGDPELCSGLLISEYVKECHFKIAAKGKPELCTYFSREEYTECVENAKKSVDFNTEITGQCSFAHTFNCFKIIPDPIQKSIVVGFTNQGDEIFSGWAEKSSY